MSKLNVVVNATLVIAFVIFAGALIRHWVAQGSFVEGNVSADGKTISLSGIQFSEYEQTVLLVLDKGCRFCERETPFYQDLGKQTRSKGTRLIVAFQHDLEAGREYLNSGGIETSDVVRVHMNSIGVDRTPTLMLLNRDGQIIGKWSGELTEPHHEYLLSVLGSSEATIRNSGSPFLILGNLPRPQNIEVESVKAGMREGNLVLLDVDEREVFAEDHPEGATNLPDDEIYARAQNELPKAKLIVVFSASKDPVKIANAKVGLDSAGFTNVAWLNLSRAECRTAGLSFAK